MENKTNGIINNDHDSKRVTNAFHRALAGKRLRGSVVFGKAADATCIVSDTHGYVVYDTERCAVYDQKHYAILEDACRDAMGRVLGERDAKKAVKSFNAELAGTKRTAENISFKLFRNRLSRV